MDDEQMIGHLISPADRVRIETRSAASDSLIQFQQGRIAFLETEVRRRDGDLAERDVVVEELQRAVVDLTRQVIDLGGQPSEQTAANEQD